jgi:uncharacterized protein (DUF2147 family)
MRRLFVIAAFLMASSAAQAQYTFEYGGKTIRIDPDRGTVSIPGVFDNTGRAKKRARAGQDSSRKQTPEQAKSEPQAPAVAPAGVPAPAAAPSPAPATAEPTAPAPALAKASPESTPAQSSPGSPPATANVVPADTSPPAQSSATVTAPAIQQTNPPAATPAPPVVATAPASPPAPTVASPAPKPNSPLGLWLTEEKEGRIRIEPCGANLCGYSVDPKSNQNGEQVLINMKPGKDSKWSGRIVDPNTGSTYDSTIALKGPDTLRVQGCAFGGMFCGGQTWSRLN